jgi:hypothetical protein
MVIAAEYSLPQLLDLDIPHKGSLRRTTSGSDLERSELKVASFFLCGGYSLLEAFFTSSLSLTCLLSVPQDTMSKEITVYSTEHRSSLVGSIKLPNKTKSIPVPVYVVIVDDNSGSMGGARAQLCVEKTKTIITDCVKQGVDYRYAT